MYGANMNTPTVRRHHLCRARRRPPRGRQRDQLLQLQRHRLRRRLHHRHARGRRRPGHRGPHLGRRRRRRDRDPLLVLWPPRRAAGVGVELCRARARRAGAGLGPVLIGTFRCRQVYLKFLGWSGFSFGIGVLGALEWEMGMISQLGLTSDRLGQGSGFKLLMQRDAIHATHNTTEYPRDISMWKLLQRDSLQSRTRVFFFLQTWPAVQLTPG